MLIMIYNGNPASRFFFVRPWGFELHFGSCYFSGLSRVIHSNKLPYVQTLEAAGNSSTPGWSRLAISTIFLVPGHCARTQQGTTTTNSFLCFEQNYQGPGPLECQKITQFYFAVFQLICLTWTPPCRSPHNAVWLKLSLGSTGATNAIFLEITLSKLWRGADTVKGMLHRIFWQGDPF